MVFDRKQYDKEYYEKNKEKIAQQQKEYKHKIYCLNYIVLKIA